MELKTITSTTVACYNLTTNLLKIGETVGVIPAKILDEINNQSIVAVGAQIWQYQGCDGDPKKNFDLKIAFPVQKMGIDTSEITFEIFPDFKCLSLTYKGSWNDFKEVYEKMFVEISQNGFEMNGYNREVYLNCDFENVENCITELQIGVK